ncbi:MAG: hypothetical protein NC313_11140 [Butyrivibrio sp.]|nr:hypothetical protein [Butyrivibrio sp.]
MAEFMKSVFKAVRRIAVLGLAACILYEVCSTSNAAAFDPLWYAEQNPDVVAALGDSPEMLELHYELAGKTECRMANSVDVEAKIRRLFNAEEYAALYPDVVAEFGNDPDVLFQHYVAYGILESRRASEDMRLSTVASLKAAMTSALESVGAEAVPGSVAILAIMEGSMADEPAVQEALVQVQDTLVEAVETTIVAASKPEVVPDDDDDDDEDEEEGGCTPLPDPCEGKEHVYVKYTEYQHTCSVCKRVYGDHDRNGHTSDGTPKCSVCEYVFTHTHSQFWSATLNDNNMHYCQYDGCTATTAHQDNTCSVSGCEGTTTQSSNVPEPTTTSTVESDITETTPETVEVTE